MAAAGTKNGCNSTKRGKLPSGPRTSFLQERPQEERGFGKKAVMQTRGWAKEIRGMAPPVSPREKPAWIKWFKDISIDDIPLVGRQNASLGEMYRELGAKGVRVPNGFAVTAEAYRYFLRQAGVEEQMRELLEPLDTGDLERLSRAGSQVRHAIMAASLPHDLEEEIVAAYDTFRGRSLHPADVAVRSSATAERTATLANSSSCRLVLGVDRDSEIVAPLFDERNPAVKKMIAQVIQVCRAKRRKIGICGHAPSDYPDFAKFLVEQGIDSISLNPDTVMKTTVAILEKEKSLSAQL